MIKTVTNWKRTLTRISRITYSTDTSLGNSTPQFHIPTILHYAVPQLQSLHSAFHTHCFAIHNMLICCDTTVHLLLSAGLIFCYSFFLKLLLPVWEGCGIPVTLMSGALWGSTLLGTVALCYTASFSWILILSSPQVWRQSVQVDDHYLCPGMPLNPVYDIVYLGGDDVWVFSALLQLLWSSSLPRRVVQPHSVAFLKTSQVGQLVVCLHLVTGHFQVLVGKVVNVV